LINQPSNRYQSGSYLTPKTIEYSYGNKFEDNTLKANDFLGLQGVGFVNQKTQYKPSLQIKENNPNNVSPFQDSQITLDKYMNFFYPNGKK